MKVAKTTNEMEEVFKPRETLLEKLISQPSTGKKNDSTFKPS